MGDNFTNLTCNIFILNFYLDVKAAFTIDCCPIIVIGAAIAYGNIHYETVPTLPSNTSYCQHQNSRFPLKQITSYMFLWYIIFLLIII